MNKDFISITDLSTEEIGELLRLATQLKTGNQRGRIRNTLVGKTLALVFEKPSLRTQATFEVGMN